MFGGSRKMGVPQRSFEPAALTYPFAFPIIERWSGIITARRTPATFGVISGKLARTGEVPTATIASTDGSVWRPTKLVAVCSTGRRLLGQELFWTQLTYERVAVWGLSELRRDASAAVENDPGDTWSQVREPSAVLAAIREAATFDELFAAIADVGGRGG